MAFRGVDLTKMTELQRAVLFAYHARERRIELQKTVCIVSAIINPQKAQDSLKDLLAEMFPEAAISRDEDVKRMVAIAKEFEKESVSVEINPDGTLRMK